MTHEKAKTLKVGCIFFAIFFLFCALALMTQPVRAQTTPTITSTLSFYPATTVVAGTDFYDTAAITGTSSSPSRDYVTYWLYSGTAPSPPSPPTAGSPDYTNPYPSGVWLSYSAVYYTDGGTVPNSPSFTETTGQYYFIVVYYGDSSNNPVLTVEPFTVTAAPLVPVPETGLGTLMMLASVFSAFGVFYVVKRSRPKTRTK